MASPSICIIVCDLSAFSSLHIFTFSVTVGSLIHLCHPHSGPSSYALPLSFRPSGQRQTHSLQYYTTIRPSSSTLPFLVISHASPDFQYTDKRLICCSCVPYLGRRLSVSAGCMLLATSTRSFGINATGLFIFDRVGFVRLQGRVVDVQVCRATLKAVYIF